MNRTTKLSVVIAILCSGAWMLLAVRDRPEPLKVKAEQASPQPLRSEVELAQATDRGRVEVPAVAEDLSEPTHDMEVRFTLSGTGDPVEGVWIALNRGEVPHEFLTGDDLVPAGPGIFSAVSDDRGVAVIRVPTGAYTPMVYHPAMSVADWPLRSNAIRIPSPPLTLKMARVWAVGLEVVGDEVLTYGVSAKGTRPMPVVARRLRDQFPDALFVKAVCWRTRPSERSPSRCRVFLRHRGWQDVDVPYTPVSEDWEPTRLEFAIDGPDRGAELTVRVVDQLGNEVPGMELQVRPPTRSLREVVFMESGRARVVPSGEVVIEAKDRRTRELLEPATCTLEPGKAQEVTTRTRGILCPVVIRVFRQTEDGAAPLWASARMTYPTAKAYRSMPTRPGSSRIAWVPEGEVTVEAKKAGYGERSVTVPVRWDASYRVNYIDITLEKAP